MRKGIFVGLICIGVFIWQLQAAVAKEIVLKFGHKTAIGGLMDRQANKFKELVEKRSDGQIKIQVYPANQLGKQRDQLEGVSAGYIDIFMEGVGSVAQFDKDMSFFSADFMFKSVEQMKKNPMFNEVLERIRKRNGIRTLMVEGSRAPFHAWTIKKPIHSLEDLQGLKFRALPTKASVEVWNGLGANATMIPWDEVYMALAQGVLDGMTHNVVQVKDEKFYETLKYVALIAYPLPASTNAIFINDAKFSSFSPDVQKMMKEAAKEAGEYFTEMTKNEEENAWNIIKEAGIELIEVDPDPWYQKAASVHKKMEERGDWSKGLIEKKGN